VVVERRCSGYAFGVRRLDASAMPALAEQLGQAKIWPFASANTRSKRSETCDPQ